MTPLITLSHALSDVNLLGKPFQSPSFWTWKTVAKVIDGEPFDVAILLMPIADALATGNLVESSVSPMAGRQDRCRGKPGRGDGCFDLAGR